jgi:hypothetical protein
MTMILSPATRTLEVIAGHHLFVLAFIYGAGGALIGRR